MAYYISTMRNLRGILTGLILHLLFLTLAYGARISFNISLQTRYNSNICSLGKAELREFKESPFAENKYKLNTYDDLITKPLLHLQINQKLNDHKLQLWLTPSYSFYLKNKIKNYWQISLGLRVSRRSDYVELSYTYMPNYHYRTYFDPDANNYIWCVYDYNKVSVEFSKRVKRDLGFKLAFQNELKYYYAGFYEYDSSKPAARLGVKYSYDWFEPELGLGAGKLIARGYDQQGEKPESSDESDISYNEYNFDCGLALKEIFPLEIGLGFSYSYLKYTTKKPSEIDPLHFGREDHNSNINLSLIFPDFYGVRVHTEASFFWRKSYSSVYHDIASIKNYFRFEPSVRITYRL